MIKVKCYSNNTNIYHCCIHKTGSQWIKSVLSDPIVFEYSGLSPYHLQVMRNDMAKLDDVVKSLKEKPLPERTIVSTLYMEYERFEAIEKIGKYKSFFVIRDPRELIVSWYYSALSAHVLPKDRLKPLYAARVALKGMSLKDGLKYAIDFWVDRGKFDLMLSWIGKEAGSVKLIKYEDLISANNKLVFKELFDYLDINIPGDKLDTLLNAYSFKRLSGRKKGGENNGSHLRSGASESWKKYFDDDLIEYFEKRTNNVVGKLGYIK
ncbi:MAG: sulfotransferase domain-containing protein [Porticoccus sp.]|nr:sulfotransferase domain-containing protein [Porticoccus sp.]